MMIELIILFITRQNERSPTVEDVWSDLRMLLLMDGRIYYLLLNRKLLLQQQRKRLCSILDPTV